MARNRLRVLACLLAVVVACLSTSPAPAQQIDEELLDLLKTLPDDERAELLRAYGLPPGGGDAAPDRDVSTPQVVLPREQPPSETEAAIAGERVPAKDEGPVAPPLERLTGEALDIQRAFENFLAESQPLEVDRQLVQFGYELFTGAPTTFAPATDIPVSSDYIIGPGDEIHVQLYGKTSFSKDLIVNRDGQVSFPELGPISVAGLTFREMKDLLAREVENRMIGVDVSVSMGRLRSIRIFVLGDVFSPGSYTVSGLS